MLKLLVFCGVIAVCLFLSYFIWWGMIALAFNVFNYQYPVTNTMIFFAMVASAIIRSLFSHNKEK